VLLVIDGFSKFTEAATSMINDTVRVIFLVIAFLTANSQLKLRVAATASRVKLNGTHPSANCGFGDQAHFSNLFRRGTDACASVFCGLITHDAIVDFKVRFSPHR
jgi:hypothetical protein